MKILTASTARALRLKEGERMLLPLFAAAVPAGFPSPADDYIDRRLDLNEYLVRHPSATFFVRVSGDSMTNAGIHAGDILIVDRAEAPASGSIVIAALEGGLSVKRLFMNGGKVYLVPENSGYSQVEVTPDMQFEIWGVALYAVHPLTRGR